MLYRNENLNEISFPLGGIGTGSIGLGGNGHLVDWEIFNRPNKGSLNGYTHFAVKAEFPDGKSVVKVLQGDVLNELSGRYQKECGNGFGNGIHQTTMAGFPHFKNVVFNGEFPIAELTFTDDTFPGEVILTAFNPFIPLDSYNSSLPAAFFDIKIKNYDKKVKYSILFSVLNPFPQTKNTKVGNAIFMENIKDDKDSVNYGDLTITIDKDFDLIVQQNWYRGSWGENITAFWRELTDGSMKDRIYDGPGNRRDHCTLGHFFTLSENEIGGCKFVLSWNIPNNYNYWSPKEEDKSWKNYYATQFESSLETAKYSISHFDELYSKTDKFRKSLFNSSLDDAVKDAISATISVLKSPTVLRLEDGTFYGWEGTFEQMGSCEGTCTHVWSYTYALCFLFPDLERSIRECEFKYDVRPTGMMQIRTLLPLGRTHGDEPYLFCLDGHMATIFKVYRDLKISGNVDWLKANWQTVKTLLEFAWSKDNPHEWDLDCDGVLEGRQHHTLDKELFGPSAWLEGMYLLALRAGAEMAQILGDTEAYNKYTELFEKGYKYTKENLFNGKYFFHKIDLTKKEYTEHFNCPEYWSEEKGQLILQIGEGSGIDQMLAQFHSNLCGLGDIFDKEQRKTALLSMYDNNFKKNMRDVPNMWRVYALNDEAGAIICDYPEGANKPIIPITYCEECMTGFEYAYAGLLISEGFVEEGLNVVRAIRNRYDGKKRNPWNELECGSNYARAMASFALIPIFSGFEFDMTKGHIGFKPIADGDFKCIWSLESAWGDYIREASTHKLILNSGELKLNSLRLKNLSKVTSVMADGKKIEFTQNGDTLLFDVCFANELSIK